MNVNDALKSRRTIRKFEQTPITKEQLKKYIDAARVAPSGGNLQPLKYVAVHSQEMTDKMFELVKWAAYLAPEYNPKEVERPMAYIVVCADTSIRKAGYDLDVGAAVENMILSAMEEGVGSCWMGAIDRKKIAELLDIPKTMEISCLLALGYPLESPKAVEVVDDNIKYYLDGKTICVPKRSLDDVIIKTV